MAGALLAGSARVHKQSVRLYSVARLQPAGLMQLLQTKVVRHHMKEGGAVMRRSCDNLQVPCESSARRCGVVAVPVLPLCVCAGSVAPGGHE